MKSITLKLKDGTTTTLEGELLSVSEVQVRRDIHMVGGE